MTAANPVATPIIKGTTIRLGKDEDSEFDVTDYQCLVEKLMHLSQTTRADLASLVGRLGQYMADPRLGLWRAAKRAFRYRKGTMHLRLESGSDVDGLNALHKLFPPIRAKLSNKFFE